MNVHNLNISELEDYIQRIFEMQSKIGQGELDLDILEFQLKLNRLAQSLDKIRSLHQILGSEVASVE